MANTGTDDEDNIEIEDTDQGSRELGVEFGELGEELEAHEYPTTAETLIGEYGDHELELPSGEESFREVLGPYADEADQEFTDAGAVRQAVLSMVGDEAVGEAGYSDRGVDSEGDDTDSF
ncbi:MAG: hypothetical protein U9O06_04800 [Euryarchaeota archaeon]|nr:hypothetical protein [Euryarchaeota archaeon]